MAIRSLRSDEGALLILFLIPVVSFNVFWRFSLVELMMDFVLFFFIAPGYLIVRRRIGSAPSMMAPRPDGTYFKLMDNADALDLFILPSVLGFAVSGAFALRLLLTDEAWRDGTVSAELLHALYSVGLIQFSASLMASFWPHVRIFRRIRNSMNSLKSFSFLRVVFDCFVIFSILLMSIFSFYLNFIVFFEEKFHNIAQDFPSFFYYIIRGFQLYIVASVGLFNLFLVAIFRLVKSIADKFLGNSI